MNNVQLSGNVSDSIALSDPIATYNTHVDPYRYPPRLLAIASLEAIPSHYRYPPELGIDDYLSYSLPVVSSLR